MIRLGRAAFALTLSFVLLALTLVLMPSAGQHVVKGGNSALTSSETGSEQQMAILVDDYAQQFNQGYQPCQGHNRLGGDWGPINDGSGNVVRGQGRMTATIMSTTSTGVGIWTSLNHHIYECSPINFSAIFPPQIKPEFQGQMTGLRIEVITGTGTISVELKLGHAECSPPYPTQEIVKWNEAVTLSGGPRDVSFDLPSNLGQIQTLSWSLLGTGGDFVVVDRVELTATVPYTDTPQRAFLWSYAQLLYNWDPKSGLTRDHACYEANQFDNISASGLQAAAAALAWHLGFISEVSATAIVTRTTEALLALPRCHGLWPHFTQKVTSGTEIISNSGIVPGTEWSSIDTTIAAIALIEAREALRLDTKAVEDILKGIAWQDLILPNGSISHGYTTATPECARLRAGGQLTGFCECSQRMGYDWRPFGLESWIVNLGYAAATGRVATFEHAPPTWNGGGFVDELAWLLMPPLCRDRWGTDWCSYSQKAVDRQLGYYHCQEAAGCCGDTRRCQEQDAKEGCSCCQDHPCYGPLGLFGLTPNEVPDLSAIPLTATRHYLDFGVCGKASCIDGTGPVTIPGVTSAVVVSLGHAVIVPHYTGIIASLRPTQAITMWNWLEGEGLFTPLNNAESFMFTDELTSTDGPTCTQIVWNSRKGSWEIALQTLGWGRYLTGNNNAIYQGVMANDMLQQGYMVMKGHHFYLPLALKNYPDPQETAAMRTYHDKYVTAMEACYDWKLRALKTSPPGNCEKFTLSCLDDGRVAFRTCHNRYVTAMGNQEDWVLRAETQKLDDWEKFTFVDTETEQQLPCSEVLGLLKRSDVIVALKTCHGR